jgi:hypothetical protein
MKIRYAHFDDLSGRPDDRNLFVAAVHLLFSELARLVLALLLKLRTE